MEKLNSSSHTVSAQPVLRKFDFGDRTPLIKPPAERILFHVTHFCSFFIVLLRLQAFRPLLEASNAIFAQRAREDPNSIDIPVGMDQYVEIASFIFYLHV